MKIYKKDISISTTEEIKQVFIKEWGANYIVTKGKIINYNDVKGFSLKINNKILGLITYLVKDNEIEITSLNSFYQNIGVGTLLLNTVIEKLNDKYKRIFLITTNNNKNALKFYKNRNFIIKNIFKNSINEARKIKPEIPKYDINGIEIKDEIELEYKQNATFTSPNETV